MTWPNGCTCGHSISAHQAGIGACIVNGCACGRFADAPKEATP